MNMEMQNFQRNSQQPVIALPLLQGRRQRISDSLGTSLCSHLTLPQSRKQKSTEVSIGRYIILK